jgi:hypothetical protein
METVWPGILVGTIVGVVAAAVTQALAYFFQFRKGVKEKKLDLYLELMSLASDELFRAGQAETAYGNIDPLQTDEGKKWWEGSENQRHTIRRDIARVVSKLRLVELDEQLRAMLIALPKAQPFLRSLKPQMSGRNFECYEEQIQKFDAMISAIAAAVLKQHAWLGPFEPMVTAKHSDESDPAHNAASNASGEAKHTDPPS